MNTLIVLLIYIVGVYAAYFQLQKWATCKVTEDDEYQVLFMVSLLSWFVYPLYWGLWLYRNLMED